MAALRPRPILSLSNRPWRDEPRPATIHARAASTYACNVRGCALTGGDHMYSMRAGVRSLVCVMLLSITVAAVAQKIRFTDRNTAAGNEYAHADHVPPALLAAKTVFFPMPELTAGSFRSLSAAIPIADTMGSMRLSKNPESMSWSTIQARRTWCWSCNSLRPMVPQVETSRTALPIRCRCFA